MYNLYMTGEDKIRAVKAWLGSGSVNIFGIQFAGKDSIGVPLARQLGGEFISSGDIVRAAAIHNDDKAIQAAAQTTTTGALTPTNEFQRLIVPYLTDKRLAGKPLVLGSVGRWIGEEDVVMDALHVSGHDLRAAIVLNITMDEVWRRWENVRGTRNGGREDDLTRERVEKRLNEYREKTLPVIAKYRQMGLVIDVDAMGPTPETLQLVIDTLYRFSQEAR